MASIVKFTPICGVDSTYGAHCYILQLDDFKFMLDCGWDTSRPETHEFVLEKYKQYASEVDCILISFPDMKHMGGLPRFYKAILEQKKSGKQISKPPPPIYASWPTKKMGQLFLYRVGS